MDNALVIGLGLFGGVLGTLLWEVVLKPRWDKRSVGLLLVSEVSLNMKLLAAVERLAASDRIPADLELGTTLFNASTDRLGLLPAQIVGEVNYLYRYFENLNGFPARYSVLRDRLTEYTLTDVNRRQLVERELGELVKAYNDMVTGAINRCNLVQPMLLKEARPWWHLETWTAPKPKQLSAQELADTLEKSQQRRDAQEKLLRDRGR